MSGLFLKVVNMSISASWLVLAVLLLRFLLKRAPRWVHVLLWGIVAVRLICPVSIESGLSLIPSPETISPGIMMERNPQIDTGVPILNEVVNPVILERFAPEPQASANPLQILIPVASVIWLVGIGLLLIYTAATYWRLRRKVDTAVILRDNIFQSEYVSSPFVLGLVKPRIYLPYTMGGAEMNHVIAHEQAHIRRGDHWWKPLGFLLLTLHWFNPLMWAAYVLLCRDIELACDEKVIMALSKEERANYTQALVACSVSRKTIAACPLAFGEVGVKERVKSVMNYKKPGFWIILAAVVICLAVAICFLTNPENQNSTLEFTTYYGTVAEQGSSMVPKGPGESRGYIKLHTDDGEELVFWTEKAGTEFVSMQGDHVMVYARAEKSTGLLVANRVARSDNTWTTDQAEAIQNAVLDFNWSTRYEGMIRCADFELLANEVGCIAATNQVDTAIFYGIALHQVFSVEDGKLIEESGSHVPTVLTFSVDESGRYILKEYWEPRAGSYYTSDIKAKFISSIWPDTQKFVEAQEARNLAKAAQYLREATASGNPG